MMTRAERRSRRLVLQQRRAALIARSQAQRAAVAVACRGATLRLRWLDQAWCTAIALPRHPGLLALAALACRWLGERRGRGVASPQSKPPDGGSP